MEKMEKTEHRNKTFYRALQGLSLFIPCAKNGDGQIVLRMLVNANGQQFVPAFFSRGSRIGDFPENELVEFAFPKLRNIFIDLPDEICGVVIEPFERNILVNRQAMSEYDSETKGMTVTRHDHEGKTVLCPAKNLPKGLKEAVVNFFGSQIGVNAAWILLAQGESEKIPHLMFAVDFYGSKLSLFPMLADVIKPFMQPGQQFELIEKKQSLDPLKLRDALVYRRGKGAVS